MASLLKSICYELGTINLYLEGRQLVLALFASGEVVGRCFSRGIKQQYNSTEAKVPLMEKLGL